MTDRGLTKDLPRPDPGPHGRPADGRPTGLPGDDGCPRPTNRRPTDQTDQTDRTDEDWLNP
ncbi:hypothetical protein GCM10018790_28260 [Kitasatospora xanthocidica]|nr:hypothetical protein GCM10018790_28260 [Kitasatospora xanthocidica]